MKNLIKRALLTMTIAFISLMSFGQGSTTSAFNGKISDSKGATLPGATVQFIHQPTGTKYGTVTNANGAYFIPNVKPGGPYLMVVSFVGFSEYQKDNIQVDLGDNQQVNANLSDKDVTLNEVVISSSKVFNSSRTGASTNVSSKDLSTMPTISRSLNDFTRLSPQVTVIGSGISIAGTNNRYNNFQIDGTVNNDVFGLAATGTNGGQAGVQPISLDAIDQIQVVVAPYDVRQSGFTGGGINAITKSGTNKIKGSVYAVGNSQELIGKYSRNNGKNFAVNDSKEGVLGLTLGGPIIKDKLFLFVNGELSSKSVPSSNNINAGSLIAETDAQAFYDKVKTMYAPIGYNPGGFEPFTNKRKSQKIFTRLDWNISDRTKLTFRYNYVNATDDNLSRSTTALTLNNGGYTFFSKTNGFVAELNTRFSPVYSNELRVGATFVRDSRSLMGGDAPNIYISKYSSAYNYTFAAGAETSSGANALNQNIWTISDNFSMFLGKHTVTLGTHNEIYHFSNLFIQNATGSYTYNSFADFLNNKIGSYNYSYIDPSIGDNRWAAGFNAAQFGLYAQDEWKVTDNFKLTYGIRFDLPYFFDKPSSNTTFNNDSRFAGFDVKTDQLPKTRVMYSPRLGFNWDVLGDRTFQLRGGTGIFTGRVPFVWISNQFSNTGVEVKSISLSNPTASQVVFTADPTKQPSPVTNPAIPIASYTVNVISKDFKFPQVWRTNLAFDYKLPGDVNFTFDAIYSKSLNNIKFQNLNITNSGQSLVGAETNDRVIFKYIDDAWVTNPNSRPYVNTIYLTNSHKGYSYSLSGQASKNFNFGLNAMASYTYGVSRAANDGTSSVALSNWRYNEVSTDKNNPEVSYTDFDLRHKVIGSLSYNKNWGSFTSTHIGLFYSGTSGLGYSLCYGGSSNTANDINRDGFAKNDLIYIFTDKEIDNLLANAQLKQISVTVDGVSKVLTAADQAADLKSWFASNSYTKDRRGEYAERNGARTPWEHHFDLHIAQDFNFTVAKRKQTIQVSFDVLNVGNLINNKWGKSYNRGSDGNDYYPITFEGFKGTSPSAGANYYTPVYSFNKYAIYGSTPNIINGQTYTWDDFYSRWRGQIGLRWIF